MILDSTDYSNLCYYYGDQFVLDTVLKRVCEKIQGEHPSQEVINMFSSSPLINEENKQWAYSLYSVLRECDREGLLGTEYREEVLTPSFIVAEANAMLWIHNECQVVKAAENNVPISVLSRMVNTSFLTTDAESNTVIGL